MARLKSSDTEEEASPNDVVGDGVKLLSRGGEDRAYTYSDALALEAGQGDGDPGDAVDEAAVMRKVNRHLIWRICLICFLNYLDRCVQGLPRVPLCPAPQTTLCKVTRVLSWYPQALHEFQRASLFVLKSG
jgi:hypothetical protein